MHFRQSSARNLAEKDKSMFKVGDSICYLKAGTNKQETFKGMVLEVRDKVKISYHNSSVQHVVWVDPGDLEIQNTSRCAHNAECGWCDDTGKCIYESPTP